MGKASTTVRNDAVVRFVPAVWRGPFRRRKLVRKISTLNAMHRSRRLGGARRVNGSSGRAVLGTWRHRCAIPSNVRFHLHRGADRNGAGRIQEVEKLGFFCLDSAIIFPFAVGINQAASSGGVAMLGKAGGAEGWRFMSSDPDFGSREGVRPCSEDQRIFCARCSFVNLSAPRRDRARSERLLSCSTQGAPGATADPELPDP